MGRGRAAFGLSESEVRYAINNSTSNRGAAAFLDINPLTWKKYAKMYVDSETGKTLYDLHSNKSGKGLSKIGKRVHLDGNSKYSLLDILDGKCPDYSSKNFKNRLIKSGLFEEKCALCGFCERRVLDYSIPLLLEWIDEDVTNHKRENLRLLCYNCYYLNVGNIVGNKKKFTYILGRE